MNNKSDNKKHNSILVFCPYLPAKRYGGPVKSIHNLVEYTSEEFQYYIISPDHDFKQKEKLPGIRPGWNRVGNANVLYVNERDYKYSNILLWIRESNALLVYLCSVYYYKFNFPAVKAAREVGIPCLLAPRSDLLVSRITRKYIRKFIFLKFVNLFGVYSNVLYHSTCREETESIIKWMKVDRSYVVELPNIATSTVNVKERKPKKKGELRLIYIGRVHPDKNLKYAIECVLNVKGKVIFDVYGPVEDSIYWNECLKLAERFDDEKTFSYGGVLSLLDVQDKYYEHDCLFFPTKGENYGHVIVESIIAGCPAVISKGTTPWDDYADQGGFCIGLDEKKDFIKVLQDLLDMDDNVFSQLVTKNIEYSNTHFDSNLQGKEYINCFNNIINKDYKI